jgi:hypothetical protein
LEQWFYESAGSRNGPVSKNELQKLIDAGSITADSLVWTNRFGAKWKAYSAAFPESVSERPPPLPSSFVNGFYGWAIAMLPLIGGIFEKILLNAGVVDTTDSTFDLGAWILAYCTLMAFDTTQITRSGRNSKKIGVGGWFWLVPIYLIQRSRALSHKQILPIVWIVSFIASVFLITPDILSEPIYLGTGIPACGSSTEQLVVKNIFGEIMKDNALSAMDIKNIQTISASDNLNQCTADISADDQKTYSVKYSITQQQDKFNTRVELQQ